ncbi:hypothetical protein GCM10017784_11310 [Deinococcus indicus]|uniref:hypothetical protein n=1 Tax=Deinococcus indicus TaxID=223556 RepID=UPI00174E1422|nr:hypothetical protein [Deinococcus indicus]GHG21533.1 hypothetical protein GCM10017784_11310 [Deinococcus indicus]
MKSEEVASLHGYLRSLQVAQYGVGTFRDGGLKLTLRALNGAMQEVPFAAPVPREHWAVVVDACHAFGPRTSEVAMLLSAQNE